MTTATHTATPKACPKPPSLKHYREVRKFFPHLTPGTYGLGIFLAEPVDPVIEADFNRRRESSAVKLGGLECTCGVVPQQVQGLLHHEDPEVRSKALEMAQGLILQLQEVVGGVQ